MAARFWIGGSGNWNDTAHWSTTTGGTGGASVPVAGDTVTFDSLSGTGTCTSTSGATCASITLNTSTLGFTLGAAMTITGNCTVTLGTFSLGTFTFTCGSFGSNNTNTRTIDFGTGNITLSGSGGSIWTTATVTGLTISGTPVVNVSYSGATACTVAPGAIPEASAISFNFTAGTYSLQFLASTSYSAKNVNFTGFKGTWSSIGNCNIYGDLTLDPGMAVGPATNTINFTGTGGTYTISSNGTTVDCPITFNGIGSTWRMTDNLTVGATRTTTLTNGTINLDGYTLSTGSFSSSNNNSRTIAFGTGNITLTGAGGSLWATTTGVNLIITTGTPTVNVTYNGSTATSLAVGGWLEAYAPNFNFKAGTYTLNFLEFNSYAAGNVDFTGFSGSWGLNTNQSPIIYGSLKLSSTMTITPTATTGALNFKATSGTKTIFTAGNMLKFSVNFNGAGGTWVLQDAFTLESTKTLTHTNGTINLNDKTLTSGNYTTAAGIKNLTFNGGILVCLASTTTAFNNAVPSGFSTTAGSKVGTISMEGGSAKTFVGAGGDYSGCYINQGGAGTLTITGTNKIGGITNTNPTASTIIVPTGASTTISGSFSLKGSAGNLVTLQSSSNTVTATFIKTNGIADCDYLSYRDTTVNGGYWYAGFNSNSISNNNNWIQRSAAPLLTSGSTTLFDDLLSIF